MQVFLVKLCLHARVQLVDVFEQFLVLLIDLRNVDAVFVRPDKNWHSFVISQPAD